MITIPTMNTLKLDAWDPSGKEALAAFILLPAKLPVTARFEASAL